jgi:hypothetical protein
MSRTLTLLKGSASDGVSVFPNVAGQFTIIFQVKTPKSRFFTVLNNQSFIMKLFRADNVTEIDPSSRVLPLYLAPTMRVPKEIGTPINYSAWRYTPLDGGASNAPTQYNVETSARRRLQFETGKNLTMPQDWSFILMLSVPAGSLDIVDWTQSNTFIELQVEESAVATQVAA